MKYIQVKKIEDTEWECLIDFKNNPKEFDDYITLEQASEIIYHDYDIDVDQIRFWDILYHKTDGKVYNIYKEPTDTEGIAHKVFDSSDIRAYEEGIYTHEEEEEYEYVDSPTHYNTYEKEVIDMMVDIYGKEKVAIFCEINAFKYRMRMGTKPGQDVSIDLDKEKWYLDKKNELKG